MTHLRPGTRVRNILGETATVLRRTRNTPEDRTRVRYDADDNVDIVWLTITGQLDIIPTEKD